jgi:hypothetical protein
MPDSAEPRLTLITRDVTINDWPCPRGIATPSRLAGGHRVRRHREHRVGPAATLANSRGQPR